MASETIVLGMGCFWGAEKRMAAIPGVLDVEAGYANGDAADTSYEAVLALEREIRHGASTARNHAEVVRVCFDPARVSLAAILAAFWENHDPTQHNRQGNDIGSNYRSAVYYTDAAQRPLIEQSRAVYQAALDAAGYGQIVSEIAPLRHYVRAEDYHQDYLQKNPDGYCGLGGTGVRYQLAECTHAPLETATLDGRQQLIVFEAEDDAASRQFATEVLADWRSPIALARTFARRAPAGWRLAAPLLLLPCVVHFVNGEEVARYSGYAGHPPSFWQWLGRQLLSPEQQRIAFAAGTEMPGSGCHLMEKRPGTYVDPITGQPLFRSDAKFDSGSGWPSFFSPLPGALSLHEDHSHGMHRVEVRSRSSGIHLGHVFDDGPPPEGKRYCINGHVLTFIPDSST